MILKSKVSPIVYNYVNRTVKTTLITGVPFFLFFFLQLHTRKYGKVVEIGAKPVSVGVSSDKREMTLKWKSVDIGGFRCKNIAKRFPDVSPNQREMGKLSTNNR